MQQPRNASPRRPQQTPAARRASAAPEIRRATEESSNGSARRHAGGMSAGGISGVEAAFRHALDVTLPGWIFAPLRLFLAVTFIYAGIQKLTDPQFFNPHAIGYIGNQIKAFAIGSPINGLLVHVVAPHAQVWGGAIAWGEIAIGLGALLGLLLRPAAFFGALLSLLFFLSASWRVRPYFYGADIVYVFAWATLLLAGPLAGGWPSVDLWLAQWIERRVSPQRLATVRAALALALGTAAGEDGAPTENADIAPTSVSVRGRGSVRASQRARQAQAEIGRRQFVRGAVVGGGVMLVVTWLWSVTHPAPAAPATGTTGGTTGATSGASTPASGSTAGASNVIAQVSSVPANSSATFTIPANGDPGVVVHLQSGKFVAFDATCTHQGCPVSYDPSSQLLLCPCHGAAFDPAQSA
ncbi:MAG TPA: TQO small subunit DoxD, partial [Ktedonobacterales bacterium]|nr:TQO small subunit DoxD [Ktedonobacterales bacterium]